MMCSSVVWCVLMWCGVWNTVYGLGCGLRWCDVMCSSVVWCVSIDVVWCGVCMGWGVCWSGVMCGGCVVWMWCGLG